MLVVCLKERKGDENPYYHTAIFGSRLVNDLVSIFRCNIIFNFEYFSR